MKKKVFLFVFAMLLFTGTNVYAANDGTCDSSELKELKVEAQNMTFQYELVKETPEIGSETDYYYTLKVYDYSSNFVINYGSYYFDSDDVNDDGELVIDNIIQGGSRITFTIYASESTDCGWETVTTKTITFPYYNKYSEYEECVGYEDLDICKSTTDTSSIASDEEFLENLENDKLAQTESEEEEKSSTSKGFISKVVDYYLDHKVITIPVTIILVLCIIAIVVIIIRRKNKKVKVDLGGKL